MITVQVPVPSGLLARGAAPHSAAAARVAEDRRGPVGQRRSRRRRRFRPPVWTVRGLLRLLPHPRRLPRGAGPRRLLHSLRPSEDVRPEQVINIVFIQILFSTESSKALSGRGRDRPRPWQSHQRIGGLRWRRRRRRARGSRWQRFSPPRPSLTSPPFKSSNWRCGRYLPLQGCNSVPCRR